MGKNQCLGVVEAGGMQEEVIKKNKQNQDKKTCVDEGIH